MMSYTRIFYMEHDDRIYAISDFKFYKNKGYSGGGYYKFKNGTKKPYKISVTALDWLTYLGYL